jgi:hypothetical protein
MDKKSIADIATEIGLLKEFTIQDAIALMPIEDIIKRETLIEQGLYDFKDDIALAKYWREVANSEKSEFEKDINDPLFYHKLNEPTQDKHSPVTQPHVIDFELSNNQIIATLSNGNKKTIDLPVTKTVDRIVSGNSVNRKPDQIFIDEDCFEYLVKIGKQPAPNWVFLYDADGNKCNPQFKWEENSLIILSNVNLKNHLILLGV